jgi:ABC-type phosphate transport system permease subunit
MENTNNVKELYKMKLQAGDYKTNHLLHLILTIFTAGAWTIIWAMRYVTNESQREKAEKIVYGQTIDRDIFGKFIAYFVIVLFTIILSFIISITDKPVNNNVTVTEISKTL